MMMRLVLASWPLWIMTGLSLVRGQDNSSVLSISSTATAEEESATESPTSENCFEEVIDFDPFQHKQVYTVGVHATKGLDAALEETDATFATFLTHTAGRRFNPPIEFRVVPLYFDGIFKAIDNDELDFLYR